MTLPSESTYTKLLDIHSFEEFENFMRKFFFAVWRFKTVFEQ